jgi:hypothetical protein
VTLRGAEVQLDFRPGEELGADDPDNDSADSEQPAPPAASLEVARGKADDSKLEIKAANGIGFDAGGGIVTVGGSGVALGVATAGSGIGATTATRPGRVDAAAFVSLGDMSASGELPLGGLFRRTPPSFGPSGVSTFPYPVVVEDLHRENGLFPFRVFRAGPMTCRAGGGCR